MINEFNSTINHRKTVLVVDDNLINRTLLGAMLEPYYDLLYAENGVEALAAIRENISSLSLVLLDLVMPEMGGMELLGILRQEIELSKLPVIVLTSEIEYEVKCLQLGAMDFIRKPFDAPEIILARINRVIELTDDRKLLEATEHDSTGLYTRNFFLEYVLQLDTYKEDMKMDTIAVSLDHFQLINEMYGREFADRLLQTLGGKIAEFVRQHQGIGCHWDAEQFYIYCRHIENEDELNQLMNAVTFEDTSASFRIKAGIYSEQQDNLDIDRRLAAARFACDNIPLSQTGSVSYYDSQLHEKVMLMERRLDEMPRALANGEFQVYFQPKMDIRPDEPVLESVEALVRWQHPEFGLMSPGRFVPLFEDNGLMQLLDQEVWRQTVACLHRWREEYGVQLTASVNVSRMDLYNDANLSCILELLEQYDVPKEALHLEITESAYTDDENIILAAIGRLKDAGLTIEMDDFGSGFSSLNTITSMPFDILKMDMGFTRGIEKDEKKYHLVELVVNLARYMKVTTIAEGVETQEQCRLLKQAGCDVVQGYYFSKPLPAEEFEAYMKEKGVIG